MKAEELKHLMIGNWINFMGSPITVTGIMSEAYAKRVATKSGISVSHEDVEPILLTPEILEKAGFVRDGSHYVINSIENDGLGRLNIGFYAPNGIMEQFQICQYMEGVGIGSIKYVHQLQNLYFSLVGSELPINL